MSTHVLQSPLNQWQIEPAHTDKQHFYKVDGVLYPSVTTILKVLDKPALMPWAAAQTVKKATELFARKTDKEGALHISFAEAQEILEEAKKKFRETSKDAADIGTIVHATIEEIMLGKPLTPVQDPNVALGLDAFWQWQAANHVKPIRVEALIASKKYGFGGTVDFIGYIGDKLVVADWKTSTGIYDEYKMQVAAYIAAVEEMLKERAEVKSKFAGAYILRFDKKTGLFNEKKDAVFIPRSEALVYFKAFRGLVAYHQAINA